VWIAYSWVDRPLAQALHSDVAAGAIRAALGYIPDLLIVAALVAMIGLPLFAWRGQRDQFWRILLILSAYVAAFLAKASCKRIAGRTWPETWNDDNPSLLRNGVYGFHPFHGGSAYGSFPSGHMTVTMAVIVAGWALFPRLRSCLAVAAPTMALLLVGLNFHFLSDVIAGAWLGTACGALTIALPGPMEARLAKKTGEAT